MMVACEAKEPPAAEAEASPAAAARLVLLDWEAVGVGSGPQDLGQFLISHSSPSARRAVEDAALARYHAELQALNPKVAMTLAECRAEYAAGGAGRWFWLLPLLAVYCPPVMAKYFHDQLLAFVDDHGFTAENVPAPRA